MLSLYLKYPGTKTASQQHLAASTNLPYVVNLCVVYVCMQECTLSLDQVIFSQAEPCALDSFGVTIEKQTIRVMLTMLC